ncbi:MAG TPA: hypothetical protein V6D18_03980 [Thermosynechococcaceae cyanobacterium]
MTRRSRRSLSALIAATSFLSQTLWIVPPAPAQITALCATPGKDGSPTITGVVNTYYPGAASVGAGATSIPVGIPAGGTPIAAGDLLLVIQIQGATFNSSNSDAYGDGVPGDAPISNITVGGPQQTNLAASGVTGTPIAGNYEFVVATSTAAGTVAIQGAGPGNGLLNSYVATPFGTQGQQTYQVIRVPQYATATLGNAVALPWNGAVGGVLAIDVADNLNLGGGTADVSGLGFRGGGGRQLGGDATLANTDFVTLSTSAANGSKGEGIAGTPRFLFNPATSSIIDNVLEGYPGGSYGRGAPGNAGGGSTDGRSSSNELNSGGGGGGNGGFGGIGGRSFNLPNEGGYNPPTFLGFPTGGFSGAPYASSTSRIILGGGGGAGTTNNGTQPSSPGDDVFGFRSSGAPGGGVVLVRTNSVSNTGTINANGANALDTGYDGGGGGGAGGSVVFAARSNSAAGLTVNANGGSGGNAVSTAPFATDLPHGPGGGGGGGAIYASPGGTYNRAGGANGITRPNNPVTLDAQAGNGVVGTIVLDPIPGVSSGADCSPRIGITKRRASVVSNGNGTFTVGYDLRVQNLGVTALSSVQIAEDLTATYASAAGFSFGGATVTGGTPLTINPAYTGTGANINLLAANQSLPVAGFSTIRLNIVVTPGSNLGPYNNNATATGASALNPILTTSDVSQNDVNNTGNPDPDGDGNLNNNNDPTSVTFTLTPSIGIAKQAGTPIDNGNGTFTIPYTFRLSNLGNTNLTNVQATEDLSGVYESPASFAIADPPTGTGITANPSFTGTGANVNLLAAGQTLAIGATATVTLNVIVTPNGNFGPYSNQAGATATDPSGNPAPPDRSNDGANSDPDNDGDPTNNNTPTRVSLPSSTPRLGVSKQRGTVTANDDGSYTVPYSVLVRNFSTVPIANLQLTEDLASVFVGAASVVVPAPPTIVSGTLSAVNSGFNGNSSTGLLSGTETLAAGQSATIAFTVRVVLGSIPGPYDNVVTAVGTGPGGVPVSDISTDQTGVQSPTPDPDGNGDPSNDSIPTRVSFGPRFRLLKRITSVTRSGALISGVNFGAVVNDAEGLAAALSGAGLPPIGVPTIPPTTPLASGDEVEYTIYFLSDGETPAIDPNLCDQVPSQATLIADSNRLKLGSAEPVRGGTVFSPIAPLPDNNACPDQANPNGSVLFNLGNVSSTRGSNTGFVRLRVRVN